MKLPLIYWHFQKLKFFIFLLFISFLLTILTCFIFKTELIFFISKKFISLNQKFIFTGITTGFWVYWKVLFYSSCFFITPLLIYFLYSFFSKSQYRYQNSVVWKIFIIIILLFSIILSIFYRYLFNSIILFFLQLEKKNPSSPFLIYLEARFDQYWFFFFHFILCIFLLFICPLIILMVKLYFFPLQYWSTVRISTYFFILCMFLLIIPPDPILQFLISLIIIFILELIIFIFYFIEFVIYIYEGGRIRTYDE